MVGISGSGKSSLVAAGLIPRLVVGAIVGSKDWIWVRFTPGEVDDNPFIALALPFKETLQPQGQQPRDFADRLEKNPATLLIELRDLALAGKPDWADLLLFIDQFEELFTLVAPRYVGPFIAWLRQAVQTDRIRVVTTLRVDFYHRCVKWPALAELLRTGSYPLAAPDLGVMYEMITRPAERAGLTFENDLVERILDDTGTEPGALPLMAFTLAELYEAKTCDGRLTQAAYNDFQGVHGAIAQRAETTFGKLSEAVQKALGEVFQVLVGVDEQGAVTLQRALWEQVVRSVEAEQLVNAFIDARLLVANRGEGTRPIVEVAHEALLTSWPLLADWIKDMQEELKLLRRLKLDAAEWDQKGRTEEYLWPNGRRLQADYMRKRLRPKLNEIEELFLKTEPKYYLPRDLSVEYLHAWDDFRIIVSFENKIQANFHPISIQLDQLRKFIEDIVISPRDIKSIKGFMEAWFNYRYYYKVTVDELFDCLESELKQIDKTFEKFLNLDTKTKYLSYSPPETKLNFSIG